jgi:hypothetical protein
MIATALILLGLISAVIALLGTILTLLSRDAWDTYQERELARLTAELPGGRHRAENAPGTRTQRRLDDTSELDTAALRRMLTAGLVNA